MKTLVLLSCVALATSFSHAEEQPVDDAAIQKSFLRQILELRDEGKSLKVAALRRELRKEKRGVSIPDLIEPATTKLSSQDSYHTNKKATLIVGHIYLCDSCDEWHTNLAGGVVITPGGVAVTNYHVLDFDHAAQFAAMDESGRLFPIEKVLASDRKADLAVIQLETDSSLAAAPLAIESSTGDPITVVSHPDAHFFTFTSGRISRFSIDPRSRARRVEITATFARGSSGSGIFDEFGNLVGIVSETNSIHYEEDNRARRNLQMVIHSGVPTSSLRELLEGE
ncbi:MAG: serine protease [Verrucomicrobiota bacterium]